jgi:hypothetical protein
MLSVKDVNPITLDVIWLDDEGGRVESMPEWFAKIGRLTLVQIFIGNKVNSLDLAKQKIIQNENIYKSDAKDVIRQLVDNGKGDLAGDYEELHKEYLIWQTAYKSVFGCCEMVHHNYPTELSHESERRRAK